MYKQKKPANLVLVGFFIRSDSTLIYAKSNPPESLKDHTYSLLKRLEVLVNGYKDRILNEKVWKLLKLAVLYHDAGKAHSYFQYQIKKAMNLPVERTSSVPIPHNYLSPFFVPLKQLGLSKDERKVLIQAIAYHHERERPDLLQLENTFYNELIDLFDIIKKELDVEVPMGDENVGKVLRYIDYANRITDTNDQALYQLYILVKGLLHRLDHAASANIEIEIDQSVSLSTLTYDYLKRKYGSDQTDQVLRPLQQFANEHQEKNLILVAQTGMGKTEAALLWAGQKKTFFTLPLRVSLNGLFDRVKDEMQYTNVGLLHSSSVSYLNQDGSEEWEVIYDQSKNLSNKLLFTTIDQVLKFPFKFRGYEKYYATMAYSCVVIDEIQAYSPWVVAILIKAIEMIHKIGGKFMIMTATLPQIYLEELESRGVMDKNCLYKEFTDNELIRHRLLIKEKKIEDDVELITELGAMNKVLVIVNTVGKAVELYNLFRQSSDEVYLLHSRFIQRDRAIIEKFLKQFDRNLKAKGIWITTQLVEASIDIDFDVLFTEMATVDSLFQRFGRCYRKRKLDHEKPNVYIYTEDPSGRNYVYDSEIMDISLRFLKPFNQRVIREKDKMEMVKNVYSKEELIKTKFYKEFKQALHKLDYLKDYEYTNEEAQKLLRNMKTELVIPRVVYDEIIPLFEQLEVEEDKKKRITLRRQIEEYTVSVPLSMFSRSISPIEHVRKTKDGRKYPLMPYVKILEEDYEFDVETLSGVGIKSSDNSYVFID
jgi:CRISPR-associated endonuclease/helicase Cas3